MASREVLIYGAGMSGMVAAYILAVEGHPVLVRDQEPAYGGSRVFNPSLHTTPLDVQATSEYIGIDITPVFVPVSALSIYLHDLEVPAPVVMSYHVERSSRPQSLDTLLYNKCIDAGVKFEFDTPLLKEDVRKLEPGTIIACGLNQPAYDYLEVPYMDWYAWMATGEAESDPYAWIWLDECINEYGYISFANGIYYNLLFAYGQEIPREGLDRYLSFMKRVRDMEEHDWEYVHGVAPVTSPDNPQLMRKGLIMCGTISGSIDPFMGFGISGALVSGKVAAIAVTDKEKALEEFERFNRNYARAYEFKHDFWYDLRARVDLLEDMARILGTERTIKMMIEGLKKGRKSSAIPGFSPLSCH
ncbi:MAG TPA: NAD(P)-binding protein [Candidatus Anoxymicrobiaceae bacterium]